MSALHTIIITPRYPTCESREDASIQKPILFAVGTSDSPWAACSLTDVLVRNQHQGEVRSEQLTTPYIHHR